MLYRDFKEIALLMAAMTTLSVRSAIRIQDSQVDDVGARRDPLEGLAVERAGGAETISGDQAGDVRAVTVLVVGARISRHKDC